MVPLGWTLRDTQAQRVVLDTSIGIVDRGSLRVDSYYRFIDEGEIAIEYALAWTDPFLGERFWVAGRKPIPNEIPQIEVCSLFAEYGPERWYLGVSAVRYVDQKLAEWTGRKAS